MWNDVLSVREVKKIFFKNLEVILFSLKDKCVLLPDKHLFNNAMHCEELMVWLLEAKC